MYGEKTVNHGKWEIHTLGPGIYRETHKYMENETQTLNDWNMARNTEKDRKTEIHTVGPGIWWGNRILWKMRNTHCRMWNAVRNTENFEKIWEKHTVGPR